MRREWTAGMEGFGIWRDGWQKEGEVVAAEELLSGVSSMERLKREDRVWGWEFIFEQLKNEKEPFQMG